MQTGLTSVRMEGRAEEEKGGREGEKEREREGCVCVGVYEPGEVCLTPWSSSSSSRVGSLRPLTREAVGRLGLRKSRSAGSSLCQSEVRFQLEKKVFQIPERKESLHHTYESVFLQSPSRAFVWISDLL